MFEKLLANLPYNPGLTKQIAFYAGRLKREESIRRTGMVFIVLAFMVQFFAVLSPPGAANADYSVSDMINGGISSKEDAVRACRSNIKNYGDVMWNFKITCQDIAQATVTDVRSTDYDNRLFSLSWLPYGNTNPHSGKPTDETPLNLAKVSETIYARRLSSADTIPFSTYKVLKGTTSNGRTFFIMFGCGNLMLIGVPNPVETCRANGEIYYKGDERCDNLVIVNPPETCPYDKNLLKDDKKCGQPCPYDKSILKDSKKCGPPCPYDKTILKDDKRCVPCPYNDKLAKNDAKCRPCDEAVGYGNALACIVEHKSASNSTTGLADANGSTAQPNDVIVYKLFATNKGKDTVTGFVMQENISDVLDYADVVDLDKGKLSDTGMVRWAARDIKPGATLTHRLTVRVKSPLPLNPPTPSDPNHFDHIMTNVYGDTVTINVPLPPGVTVVNVVNTTNAAGEALPKTGPGTGLAIAAAAIVLGSYFFARTRLLVDESMLVVQTSTSGSL